jgi:hypothetical protein
MFVQTISNSHAGRNAKPKYLLSLLTALVFGFAVHPSTAQAQVADDIEANIPFQFQAGDTTLPAGEYRIHVENDSDLAIMQISSANGRVSAIFQVENADANGTPAKSELVFNKNGDRYFLAQVFEQGSSTGSQVVESSSEKAASQEATQAQEHVQANRRGQKGN